MQYIEISKITENLQMLPTDKLAVVYDFVSYLIERQKAKPQFSEAFQTMMASEAVLQRDWERPEEDAAWENL
ncbi:MAG TPA: DUF2281 domain-containing protein [Desulfobacteraceae bacterium]|nr:DUF2281 domain-containing protein [Desulfobacteraceae bacterium]